MPSKEAIILLFLFLQKSGCSPVQNCPLGYYLDDGKCVDTIPGEHKILGKTECEDGLYPMNGKCVESIQFDERSLVVECEDGYFFHGGKCIDTLPGEHIPGDTKCDDGLYPINGECVDSIAAGENMENSVEEHSDVTPATVTSTSNLDSISSHIVSSANAAPGIPMCTILLIILYLLLTLTLF